MADIRRLFSTPLALDMVDDAPMRESLRALVAAEKARDPIGLQHSNMGGWHSAPTMVEWGGDSAGKLAARTAALAGTLTLDRMSPERSRYGWAFEMWANISSRGHSNQYHVHPGCVWSAVFYVDDGYDGSETPLGGELQLKDPRMPAARMVAPDLALRDVDGSIQHNELIVRPRDGLLVVFPAWLEHGVRTYNGCGERISIAINLIPTLQRS